MKKPILFMVILFLAASAASADVRTITDPFPGSNWPSPGYDVIGTNAYFDIQKIELGFGSGGSMDVSIFTNYTNRTSGTSLAPWLYPGSDLLLSIGDLFFGFPTLAYAVPLNTHDNFLVGNLYEISGDIHTRTAENVLGLRPGWIFRRTEDVWIGGTPGTPAATGTETVTRLSPPSPTYKIDLHFSTLPADFWDQLYDNGGSMYVQFASATCGNDIIKGSVAVPEPSTVLTLSTLLLLLAAFTTRRRSRRALPAELRPRG